jgi:Uncharacterised nucleotidyltransferase
VPILEKSAPFVVVMAHISNSTRKGTLVASVLAGAWRETHPASLDLENSEFDEVTPLLYGSGAAALGWFRVRNTPLADTQSGAVLHQAYRLQALQSAIHDQKIEKLFRLLRQASIDAIVAKGWAAARLYRDAGLRPYGDIDLLVRSDQFGSAEELLRSGEASDCWVDLHQQFFEINDRTETELFARSTLVTGGSEQIRVLSAEDHLALLAIHLLKHGAWRPLWLCDIGAALENLPCDFNWEVCLGRSSKRSGWIKAAITLAHQLLDANIGAVPNEYRQRQVPAWLLDGVLKQWASPFAINQPPMSHSAPMASYIRNPGGFFKALKERWPNPILATISVNGELNSLPRLPYQIGNCTLRAGQFLLQLPSRLRSET